MTAIVATPGSGTANSFATEAQFIALTATEPVVPAGTTVSGSTCSETEKKALVRATKALTLLLWTGSRVDTTQKLSWPRQYARNPDTPNIELLGNIELVYYDDDVIPQRVVDATIYLALAIITGGTTDIFANDEDVGIAEVTVGPLTTRWFEGIARASGLAKYPMVVDLIRPILSEDAGVSELARQ